MTFFSLKLKVGHPYPQLTGMDDKYDITAPNAQRNLSYFAFPDFEPHFAKQFFYDTAEITDFVSDGGSMGGKGFIVNEKVKILLNDFNLPPHKYYPLDIKKRNSQVGQYYWLQLLIVENLIDFEQSEFFLEKLNQVVKPLHLKSQTDAQMVMKQAGNFERINFTKLYLSEKYKNQPLDLFYLIDVYPNHVVSKKLKKELEKEHITGLGTFVELPIEF